jgi:DNA-binding transcriptional LysR family regulator
VAALEEHLGVKLLERTTRVVRPTQAGLRYLEDARRIRTEVQAAGEAAAGVNAEPRGLLTVTAPVIFGRMYVVPGIVAYLAKHPSTQVHALLIDRVVSLVEEGVDVGIRIGELPDSTLRALPVGHVRLVACASPAYLERAGTPHSPHELARHAIVASSAGGSSGFGAMHWRFGTADGVKPIRVRPRLTVTTNDAAIEAAVEGFGITRVLSYQVGPYVAAGRLELLLEKFETESWPVHIVHYVGRHASAKVRTFVDLMAARLRADRALKRSPSKGSLIRKPYTTQRA